MTHPHHASNSRARNAALASAAFLTAAITCFLLPNCTVFGVLLVLLGLVYTVCLATGMDPSSDPTTTWHHLRSLLQRLAPQPGGSETGVLPPTPTHEVGPAATAFDYRSSAAQGFAPTGEVPPPAQPSIPGASPGNVDEQPGSVPEQLTNQHVPADQATADILGGGPPQRQRQYFAPPPPGPPGATYPATHNRRLLWTAVSLVSVVVVAAAVTITAVVFTRGDGGEHDNDGYAAGMLHSSYPTVPSAAFAVSPTQLGAEGFYRPNYLVGGEEYTGFLRSDRYIITGLGNGALVAFDPSDGHTVWTQKSYSGLNCSDVFDDQTIGCETPGGLMLLSANDGEVITKLPGGYSRVQKFNDKYAYARHDDASVTVSLGTKTNPTAYWSHTSEVSGGTRTRLVVSDKFVVYQDLSATGGWSYAYNEAGQSIGSPGSFGKTLTSDFYADQPGDSAVVRAGDGNTQYLTSAIPQQPALYAPAPGVSVAFTRNEAIEPSTGSVLWQRPPATVSESTSSGVGDLVAVVGTVALLRPDSIGATTGVDIRTGQTLWSSDIGVSSYDVTTDGQRIIGIGSGNTVDAYDLATGQRAWTIALPDVGAYPKVVPVGSDFAVVGSKAVLGFHPTGGAATLFDGSATPAGGRSAGESVTACSTPATVTPENFQVNNGALVVRLKFTAGCAGGDVLSNSRYSVTIRDQASAIASSQFDLSRTPIGVPRNGAAVSRDFTFPSGTFWRLPSSLAGGSGSSTSVTGSGQSVECAGEGTNGVSGGQEIAPSTVSGAEPVVGSVPAAGSPVAVDPAANALGALRAQADADRPLVQQSYINRWVAQISAKQIRTPAMVATDVDDVTMVAWSAEAILRQHLSLRSRYPEVRLLFSNDWRTIDLRDWWITVAQPNVLDAPGANTWCDSKRIAPNQCFAKMISNDRGSDGTTVYRR